MPKNSPRIERKGLFLPTTDTPLRFSSGCSLLDCVLGGGWPRGRISNIVGDFSTGKTLLAIEATANFARKLPEAKIVYLETEAAFDYTYAQKVGLPLDRVEFPNDPERRRKSGRIDTVEKWVRDMRTRLKEAEPGQETLYIIDSLDALTTEESRERDPEKGTFGVAKPKLLSNFFGDHNSEMTDKGFTLLVISQVRDAIGVMFGKKQRRSGGKALDFYASVCLWLAKVQTLKLTKKKVQRAIGVKIRAKGEKCKVGTPFQECEFPIYFNYGIEDVVAAFDWLNEIGRIQVAKDTLGYETAGDLEGLDGKAYRRARIKLGKLIKAEWATIDQRFAPTRSKYG